MELYETIGWIGAFLYIIAYFLLSLGYLSSEGSLFHILNIVGGVCLVINAYVLKDSPNFFVNALWAAIGVFSVLKVSGVIKSGKKAT